MVLTKRDTGEECSAPELTRLEALLTSWTGSAEHFNEEKVGKIEEIFHFYFRMAPRRSVTDAEKEGENRKHRKKYAQQDPQ